MRLVRRVHRLSFGRAAPISAFGGKKTHKRPIRETKTEYAQYHCMSG